MRRRDSWQKNRSWETWSICWASNCGSPRSSPIAFLPGSTTLKCHPGILPGTTLYYPVKYRVNAGYFTGHPDFKQPSNPGQKHKKTTLTLTMTLHQVGVKNLRMVSWKGVWLMLNGKESNNRSLRMQRKRPRPRQLRPQVIDHPYDNNPNPITILCVNALLNTRCFQQTY